MANSRRSAGIPTATWPSTRPSDSIRGGSPCVSTLTIVHDAPLAEGDGHMIIGEKAADLWSYGGWARVIVRPHDGDGTADVWIATERANVMNVTARFDYSGQIYAGMQTQLARN